MGDRCDTVRQYFEQAIDGHNPELVLELFTPDCQIHRPEAELHGSKSLAELLGKGLANYRNFRSEIHTIVESEPFVAVRLTHHADSVGPFVSRVGVYDVAGKPIRWEAMAMFRFEGDRIAEEWVNRDELGMLLHYQLIAPDSQGVMHLAIPK